MYSTASGNRRVKRVRCFAREHGGARVLTLAATRRDADVIAEQQHATGMSVSYALPACVRRRRLEGPVSHAPPFSGAAWISRTLDIHAAPAATPRSLDPGDQAIGALMSRDIAAPQDRAKTRRLNYHPDG